MAGGKETPRQKMIGMMYLVLTALLALNVSKQIIQAFVILNDKIESGNQIIQQKNVSTIDSYSVKIATLKAQKQLDQVKKIEEQRTKALAVDDRIKGFCNYVIMEASEMIKQSEGKDWYEEDATVMVEEGKEKWLKLLPLSEIAGMDNYDIPTHYFVGDAANPNGKGLDIIDSMIAVRNYVCKMMATYEGDGGKKWTFEPPDIRPTFREDRNNGGSEYRKALREALKTANPEDTLKLIQVFNLLTPEEKMVNHEEEVPWIVGSFDHAPIVAAAAFLSSLRADALQAESIAQDLMASKAEAPMFKFNKIEPLAFARAGYINQGDSLLVRAYVAAYDSTADSKIRYWIDDPTRAEANMKEVVNKPVSIRDASIGNHVVYGQIAVKERGQLVWKNWEFPFEVGKPSGAIGMPEMFTLYRQYDNVISAAASGYPSEALQLSGSGCTVTKSGENWIARVTGTGRTASITLSAKKPDGGMAQLAKADFSVRPYPTPTILLGGKESGAELTKAGISANRTIVLTLGDSPLKAQFTCTGYEIVIGNKVVKVSGNALSNEALSKLSTAPKGTAVIIRRVTYSGPVPGKVIAGGWTIG